MMINIFFFVVIHVFTGHAILFHCDFEEPCAGFTIDDNWNITTGNNSELIDHDHTLNNNHGGYLFLKTKNRLSKIQTTNWIESSYDQAICFNLWYYTRQSRFYFDIQFLQDDDDESFIVSEKNSSIEDWTLVHIRLPSEKVKILIHLNITSDDSLAFDDLSIDICDEVLLSFDGESSGIEDFISLPGYPYQWSIIQAEKAIEQEKQAPAIDYTFKNQSGYYFWLENLDSIEKGNVGYLATKKSFHITEEISYCLNFFYYGYGEIEMSHLKIYIRMVERPDIVQQLWPKEYQYTYNNWTEAIVKLPLGYYSLLFRIDSRHMNVSSFALDNININSCNYSSFELTSSQSLLSLSCDFDESSSSSSSICDLVNGYLANEPTFNFTIFTGNTIPNKELGPTHDYTKNSSSGGFFYWNRQSNFSEEDIGVFSISKLIEQNTDMCIKFAYYVKSSKNDNTEKMLLLHTSSRTWEPLWTIMIDDSHGWQLVIIRLQNFASAQSFYFAVAEVGLSEVSIAFDDIRFEQCSLINTTNSSTVNPENNSSTISPENNSQKLLLFNRFELLIFCFLFILIEEFHQK